VIANRGVKVVLLGSIAMLPAVECWAFVIVLAEILQMNSSAVIEIPSRGNLSLGHGALQRQISATFGSPSEARDLPGGP